LSARENKILLTLEYRDVWEFGQLLDKKYLMSSKRTLDEWLELVKRNSWIKNDE
jgi:hypothetical protein